MLWEGLRIYSRQQYSAISADCRFILTEDVRKVLHSDIPERYVGRSIIIVKTPSIEELEVEGINFLVVDDDSVPDFLIMSQREAERRYPAEMSDVRNTGSSPVAKEYQNEQEAMLKIAGGKKAAVRKEPSVKTPRKTPSKKKNPETEEPPKEKATKAEPAKLPSKSTGTRKKTEKPAAVINIPDEEPEEKPSKPKTPTPKKTAAKTSSKKAPAKTSTKSTSKSTGAKQSEAARFTKKVAVRTAKKVLTPLWKKK